MYGYDDRCGYDGFDDLDLMSLWDEADEEPPRGPVPGSREVWRDLEIPRDITPHELGRMGEALAAGYLASRGYEVIERGYRCPEGEADIVCFDPFEEQMVLVEVKTRRARQGDNGTLFPEEAIDARKRRRYRRIASCYVMDNYPVPAVRFDCVGVRVVDGRVQNLEHIFNAFDWECGR